MKFVHIFSNYLFKSTENAVCSSGNGNNNDVTNMSKMANFVIMDYDEKYITGYILGDWQDAENVIQQCSIVEENVVHLTSVTEVHRRKF